ncbi:TPA: FAD/NAD(P)-binding protein [Vibrio vulnificus]
MAYEKLVIAGAGLSSICFLKFISKNKSKKYDLLIIDLDKKLGRGAFCYNDSTLMNTPSEVLGLSSEKPHEFMSWYESKYLESPPKFVERRVFGEYVYSSFMSSIKTLESNGSSIRIIDGYIDFFSDEYVCVDNNVYYFDSLILARGAKYNKLENLDIGHLIGETHKEIYNIKGSGLTAVDVSIEIIKRNPDAKVNLFSRSGKLPQVKSNYLTPITPKYFSENELLNSISVSLRSIYRLARKEFSSNGYDLFDTVFRSNCSDDIESFHNKIVIAENGDRFFNMILGMMLPLSSMWKYISKKDIYTYHSKIHRYIHYIHGAMPLIRAKELLIHMEEKRLSINKHIQNMDFDIDCSGHERINKGFLYYCPNTFKLDGYKNVYGIGMEVRYSNPFMNNIERIVEVSEFLAGDISVR